MSDELDDDFDDIADEEQGEQQAVATESYALDEPRPRKKPAVTQPNYDKRLTKAQRNLRIGTVATMILNGYRRHDIHNYINEKLAIAWDGPSERSIDRMIASARKLIEKTVADDIDLEKNKARMRLEDLYRKANGKQLYGTALRVQRAINKLLGLEAPTKVRHGNDPDAPLPQGGGNFYVLIQEAVEG
jgi:hypothetical protein